MGLRHELLEEGTGLGCLCCLCVSKCHCRRFFLGSVCVFAYVHASRLCTCACWGYTLGLATGYTWGHAAAAAAAAASPLLGCQIQQTQIVMAFLNVE